MGVVTIQFQGICTNFEPPKGVLVAPHRVALVNAYATNRIAGRTIPPHLASLILPAAPPLPLAGCTLAVDNGARLGCTYAPSYACIPNLTAMMRDKGVDLGPPSQAVVGGKDPGLASCHFEFPGGVFSGCASPTGAAVTSVEVETDGDPVLALAPFPGSFGVAMRYPVPSGSTVVVSHAATDEDPASSLYHFLLSYLTAATMPGEPAIPGGIDCPFCSPMGGAAARRRVGASCSNSTYP